jgi:hypothetical protein
MCPVLVVAKGVDWLFLDSQGLFRTVLIGLALAIVSAVATWSALGSGKGVYRLLILVFVPPIVGAGIAQVASTWSTAWSSANYLFWQLKELSWTWSVWTALAAWFLATLLLVFRSAGYRLMYKRRIQLQS